MQNSGYLILGVRRGIQLQRHWGMFYRDGNAPYVHCSDVYMTIYHCQNSLNCILHKLLLHNKNIFLKSLKKNKLTPIKAWDGVIVSFSSLFLFILI